MFKTKKEIEALKKEITKLKRENASLKEEYKDKIIDDKANEEYRKKLDKEAKMSAELYKKNLDAVVAHELNYAFLQQLINASKDPGTLIEVVLKDGTKLTIRKENKNDYHKKAEDIFELGEF